MLVFLWPDHTFSLEKCFGDRPISIIPSINFSHLILTRISNMQNVLSLSSVSIIEPPNPRFLNSIPLDSSSGRSRLVFIGILRSTLLYANLYARKNFFILFYHLLGKNNIMPAEKYRRQFFGRYIILSEDRSKCLLEDLCIILLYKT